MRVLTRNGHFAFFPFDVSEVARFSRFFQSELLQDGDFYTFAFLQGAPDYCLPGKEYLNLAATVSFAGRGPWDVMGANGFVFDLATRKLVLLSSVSANIDLPRSDSYFISPIPLIQPGSRDASGKQIISYDGEFELNTFRLRLIEVAYG